MQCIPYGQYILVDRFLRNSGYLVKHEILSTFGCQFKSKRGFEKSKNTEAYLNLSLKWRCLNAFFPQKSTYSSAMHPIWSIYILADRFLRNSGYLVEHEVLPTLGCQFSSKRSFEKSKNTEVCLNLTLKWRR